MASISSTTSSISGTLQGYGGLASGIDRDSIIEQMTSGTTTKITNVKKQKQELQWKQEAYRGLSDKIIDLQDNYMGYASTFNIKSSANFAQNLLSALGNSDVTKYVSATGTSSMISHLSILGVRQLATSATLLSSAKSAGSIETANSVKLDETVKISNLEGTSLVFGKDQYASDGSVEGFSESFTFDFVSSYTDENGNTVEIDYTQSPEELVNALNKYVETADIQFDKANSSSTYKTITFSYDETNDRLSFELVEKRKYSSSEGNKGDVVNTLSSEYKIQKNSSALTALGYDADKREDYIKSLYQQKADESDADYETRIKKEMAKAITFGKDGSGAYSGEYGNAAVMKGFESSYISQTTMEDYLLNKTLKVTYGGQSADIQLLTKEDQEAMKAMDADAKTAYMKDAIQKRLDKAFGTDKVQVSLSAENKLSFEDVSGNKQTLTVTSDKPELRKVLAIDKNQSNKLSMDASLEKNGYFGAGDTGELDIVINDVKIEGITKDTTLNELLAKINENEEVGVKASYMDGTGQIVLVASDTGSGREIKLGSEAAKKIFGGESKDGQDAQMEISYGNGVNQVITSSTNTFQVDGVKISVSGTFGYKTDADGNTVKDSKGEPIVDTSQTVKFEAKADVDKVTENVKKFIEDYNALVEELYNQTSTRPDSEYGALTEDQKKEMSDDEIEKWEKKAKEGLLYGDSTVRDLYADLQALSAKILQSGISYEDLESIGISFSDSRAEYGKLIFDEKAFKEAMGSDPQLVSDIFTGGGNVKTGLGQLLEDTLTPYATRYATKNGNSYGRLVEEAGSEKLILSVKDNYIYEQLKQMDEQIKTLQARLQSEQDRYIKQFTTMESLISQYNTQANYISGLSS